MGPAPRISTAAVQEQRLVRQRELDFLRQELQSFYTQQRQHQVASKAEGTVQLRVALREENEPAAQHAALDRLHRTNPELQALRQAIATAQIAVERGLQLQEREFAATQEKQYDAALDQFATMKLQQAEEAEQASKSLRAATMSQTRMGLDRQLLEKEEQQHVEHERAEREREMVEAVVARIEAEDRATEARRSAVKQGLRLAMDQSLLELRSHKAAAKAAGLAEEQRIAEYVRLKNQHADEEAARTAAKRADHNRMYESVKARLEAEEAEAAEEQRLVDELRAEEVAAAARHEAAQRAAHQARLRAQMVADNQAMLANKAERRERERMEEEAFRAATLQRLAEEDRLEQLSAQRRREKTMAHRREVERLLQHRRMLFAAAQVRRAPLSLML
ncbi:hypothetical protein WJX73_002938 [Symbiochloris irregularis]|uniref:Meiosis-specific nuclear structural protein 1 n=1 Tax=Symbiochloris irregularis TaxID=706552 RepID=A0AAW1P1H2_9CHLO